MIQIAVHRSLSWDIAYSDVVWWEAGVTRHRWQDKSADCGRAHVVGWASVLRMRILTTAGAGFELTSNCNIPSAVPLVDQSCHDDHSRQ